MWQLQKLIPQFSCQEEGFANRRRQPPALDVNGKWLKVANSGEKWLRVGKSGKTW